MNPFKIAAGIIAAVVAAIIITFSFSANAKISNHHKPIEGVPMMCASYDSEQDIMNLLKQLEDNPDVEVMKDPEPSDKFESVVFKVTRGGAVYTSRLLWGDGSMCELILKKEQVVNGRDV